jgi:hypothetical protein
MVAQLVVRARRPNMVIRVTLQVEEQRIGQSMRGIPRVNRRHAFVGIIADEPPLQPVVLDVVDGLQKSDRNQTLGDEKEQ